jgi:hypothetical protein
MKTNPVSLPPREHPIGAHERKMQQCIQQATDRILTADLATRAQEAFDAGNLGTALWFARVRDDRAREVGITFSGGDQ